MQSGVNQYTPARIMNRFANNRGYSSEVLKDQGMKAIMFKGEPAIIVAKDSNGLRKVRYTERVKPQQRYDSDTGYTANVQGLEAAIELTNHTLPILVNGELSAAVLRSIGKLPAFSFSTGEGTVTPALIQYVVDAYEAANLHKTIYIIPDKDKTGQDGAIKRAKAFYSAGFSVMLVDTGLTEPGADAEDWLVSLSDRAPSAVHDAFTRLPYQFYTCETEKPEKPAQSATEALTANEQDVKVCLSKLTEWRCDERDSWLSVVMVIKNVLGDEGEDIAREWSEQSDKFDDKSFNAVWRSIKDPETIEKPLGMGTLVQWAKEDNNGINPIAKQRSVTVTPNVTPELKEVFLTSALTDAGNAKRFSEMYKGMVRYNHTASQWVIWDGKRWKRDNVGRIHQFAIELAQAYQTAIIEGVSDNSTKQSAMKLAIQLENERPRHSMLQTARTQSDIATTEEMYDADTMLLGVDNGVIELRTGTFREPRQSDYITKAASVAYDPGATCPRWEQFMLEVFDNDPDIVAYVQRAIGYSLTGDTREQVMFLLYGNGRNGKSTFLETIAALLGDYADTTPFTTFDAGSMSEQTNDLAALKGARFVSIVETDEDKRLNEAKIKMSTGQDTIKCRFLHKEFFSYKPQFKIWLAVNHKPQIRGSDLGIWRRIQTIPFNVNFTGREDKTLDSTLRAELPGILNWAIAGLQEWHNRGLCTPATLIEAANSYRKDNDVIARWLDEQATIDEQEYTPVSVAYANFTEWFKAEGYRYAMTKDNFSKRLNEKGFQTVVKKVEGKSTRVYKGFSAGLFNV